MTSKKTSDAGIFLWMVYQTMQKMNLDAAAIFASVHLPDQAPDKFVRRDNSTQSRFWHAAAEISRDQNVGLHVGINIPAFRGQVIEYLFLSSPTFGEGLKRTIRYQALLTDAMSFKLIVIDQTTAIISGLSHPIRHYLECAIGILLNFFKYMSKTHSLQLKSACLIQKLQHKKNILKHGVVLSNSDKQMVIFALINNY